MKSKNTYKKHEPKSLEIQRKMETQRGSSYKKKIKAPRIAHGHSLPRLNKWLIIFLLVLILYTTSVQGGSNDQKLAKGKQLNLYPNSTRSPSDLKNFLAYALDLASEKFSATHQQSPRVYEKSQSFFHNDYSLKLPKSDYVSLGSRPFPQLFQAVKKGDLRAIQKIIKKGFDVNQEFSIEINGQQYNYVLLHLAVFTQQAALVDYLLHEGANPNLESMGVRPLYIAYSLEQGWLMEKLVAAGATVADLAPGSRIRLDASKEYSSDDNVHVDRYTYPLFIAIHCEPGSVRRILNNDAYLTLRDSNGNYPIHVAAMKNPMQIKVLHTFGADINIADNEGETALHKAVLYNQFGIEPLLELGANASLVDQEGQNPLILAIKKTPHVVSILLKSGVDPNNGVSLPQQYNPPLHRAILEHSYTAAKDLLENGANPNLENPVGKTPTHAVVHASEDMPPALVRTFIKLLKRYNADFNRKDLGGEGLSPLYVAVGESNLLAVEVLLEEGAVFDYDDLVKYEKKYGFEESPQRKKFYNLINDYKDKSQVLPEAKTQSNSYLIPLAIMSGFMALLVLFISKLFNWLGSRKLLLQQRINTQLGELDAITAGVIKGQWQNHNGHFEIDLDFAAYPLIPQDLILKKILPILGNVIAQIEQRDNKLFIAERNFKSGINTAQVNKKIKDAIKAILPLRKIESLQESLSNLMREATNLPERKMETFKAFQVKNNLLKTTLSQTIVLQTTMMFFPIIKKKIDVITKNSDRVDALLKELFSMQFGNLSSQITKAQSELIAAIAAINKSNQSVEIFHQSLDTLEKVESQLTVLSAQYSQHASLLTSFAGMLSEKLNESEKILEEVKNDLRHLPMFKPPAASARVIPENVSISAAPNPEPIPANRSPVTSRSTTKSESATTATAPRSSKAEKETTTLPTTSNPQARTFVPAAPVEAISQAAAVVRASDLFGEADGGDLKVDERGVSAFQLH